MKILAGIVLYNPEIERLRINIKKIFPQVDNVILVDNGSQNIDAVRKFWGNRVEIIENNENKGIAAALNQILEYAINNDYEWFISLDQDSVCEENLVLNYLKYVNEPKLAIITCKIIDRNFEEVYNNENDFYEIEQCITSASFCNARIIKSVGGFDEQMFIDSVDYEVCMAVRKNGYKVFRANFLGLVHEVGNGRNVKLFRRKKIIYNHSALRNYYISRNRIYLYRKYPDYISITKTILKEFESFILMILYEKDRKTKFKYRIRGIMDGFIKKMGKFKL